MADRRARRAATPTVGKLLEIGLVALFVGAVAAPLFGGAVPAYRTAAGAELGDRTLATAGERVEAAVPAHVDEAVRVRVRARADLPRTIRGEAYRVRAANGSLVLDHPRAGVGGRTRLALPDGVSVAGTWRSDAPAVVLVRSDENGTSVRLTTATVNATTTATANGGGGAPSAPAATGAEPEATGGGGAA